MARKRKEAEEKFDLEEDLSELIESIDECTQLWFGREGIGKTSLFAQFPGHFILATEPGHRGIQCRSKDLKDWKEFRKAVQWLEKHPSRYNFIGLDTVDNAYIWCRDFICAKHGMMHPSDEGYGKGFDLVNSEFRVWVSRLAMARPTVFISHSKDVEITSRRGGGYNKTVPTMANGARKVLEPMADIIAYMEWDEERRIFRIVGSNEVIAKNRLTYKFVGVEKVDMGKSPEEAFENINKAFEKGAESPKKKKKVIRKRTS